MLNKFKNALIAFIKRSPFLYNLAKKVNRKLSRNQTAYKMNTSYTFYGYIIKSEEDISAVREHYNTVKRYDTHMLCMMKNPEYNLSMHRLIRENPDICFMSFDYFKRYHLKFSNYRIIWLNYTDEYSEILNYIS